MPESRRRRKKTAYPPAEASRTAAAKRGPSPRWLAPLMLALFGIGILWLVVFYITQGDMGGLPVAEDLDNWNLIVGFGFIIAGFALSTQWR